MNKDSLLILNFIKTNLIDKKGRFCHMKTKTVDCQQVDLYMKNHFPSLSWSDGYHLLSQGVEHEIKCKNKNCDNTVKRNSAKAGKLGNFDFCFYCSVNCANNDPLRTEKIKNTKKKLYGGMGFETEEHRKKATRTMRKKYGCDFYVKTDEFKEKTKKTLLEKWGTDRAMGCDEMISLYEKSMMEKYNIRNSLEKNSQFRKKGEKTLIEKYGNVQIMATDYIKLLKIKNGEWIADESRNEYELYKFKVLQITTQTLLEHKDILPNLEKRGRLDLNKDAFHVDHKVSICSGYENKISPDIIGSIFNLEMIPARKNCSKGKKNSMSIEELINLFNLQ